MTSYLIWPWSPNKIMHKKDKIKKKNYEDLPHKRGKVTNNAKDNFRNFFSHRLYLEFNGTSMSGWTN